MKWIDAMYVLDTGSTDGTLEKLNELKNKYYNLHVEKYHTSYVTQYDKAWEKMSNPFPEIDVRNYAITQAEKRKPTWLIQLDGDEVFLENTKCIIHNTPDHSIIGHSTINPVCELKYHTAEKRQNYMLLDPHARIWRAHIGIKYAQNPEVTGQFHCIPTHNNKHLYHSKLIKFVPDPIHFHLHWMYGKKVDMFYNNINRKEIAQTQFENNYKSLLPEIFWNRRRAWLDIEPTK